MQLLLELTSCLYYFLLLLFGISQAGLVEDVCRNTKYPLDKLCSDSFDIPTGGTTVLNKQACTDNCCFYDCGQFLGIPCTTCGQERCGETCIEVPTGISIDTDRQSLCSRHITNLVNTAVGMCNCLVEVDHYLAEFVEHLESSSQQVKAKALGGSGDVMSCLIKNGFNIQNNRTQQLSSELSKAGRLIMAPDIDTTTYINITAAIAACVTTAAACDLIIDLFYDYFQDAIDAIATGLENFLTEKFQDSIRQIQFKVNNLLSTLESLPDKIAEEIECTQLTPASFDTLRTYPHQTSINDLSTFSNNVNDILLKIEHLIHTNGTASQSLQTNYLSHLQSVIASGELPDLDDSVQYLLGDGGITDLFEDISSFISTNVTQAQLALQNLHSVSDTLLNELNNNNNTLSLPCDFDGVTSLISSVKHEIASVLMEAESIANFQVGQNSLQGGVISYKQWFTVFADLPCMKWETVTESAKGFSDSLRYLKIYTCEYGARGDMPNEHIPYLRINI